MSLTVYLIYPACKFCGSPEHCVFEANTTHNLTKMAAEAGIYYHVWRTDRMRIETAGQLIEPLSNAIEDMKRRPAHYRQFDAPNGWGLYEHFVPWLEKYLAACKEHPRAKVHVWR